MIKKLFLLSLVSLSSLAYSYTHSDATHFVKQTFGSSGMHLSLVSAKFMEELFYQIGISTPYEQQSACKKAVIILEKEIEQRETSLASVDTETKQHIEHNLAILTIQKDHYERVARLLKKEITIFQLILGSLKNITTRCIAFALSPLKKYTPPLQCLTNDLVKYTEIERHEIFTDHKKTIRLIVIQNKYPIPLIIRFWDYPRHRHRLLNGVKKFQSSAQPQAVVGLEIGSEAAAEDIGGFVLGDEAATKALKEGSQSFSSAFNELTNATTESFEEGAAQASAATITQVGKALASTTETLPTVATTEIIREKALETITNSEAAAQQVATRISAQVTAEETGEAASHEAAEQVGQATATNTETQVTETGEQTINTLAEKGKTWAEHGKEFIEMAQSLVLQVEISMGAQMVSAWQSAADALTFASLSQKRTALMTHLNHFFSQLSIQQTKALAQINANFSAQIAVIASQLCMQTTSAGSVALSGLLPTLLAVEQSFVTQALINATVKSIFLLNPMPDDQLFYYSPMVAQQTISSHTPFISNGLSTTWHNPYRSGNWQFCSVDYSGITQGPITSFVQYDAQSFTSQTYPNGDPTLAVQNSIFTEYIPPAQYKKSIESYTIKIACTLLSQPYEPFMMGVIFNGARWISGVLDLHHQHRLFCIYTEPNQKPGTYNVGFAETFYQNQEKMNISQNQLSDQNIAGLNAIWPAYQILSPSINALAAVATSNAALPITNPIATIPALPLGTPYILTIETQPNQVTLTISAPNGEILYPAEQTTSSLQNELSLPNQFQKLNALMFLYHNIGFISPGCSAQFIIQKPTDLCFSESQIKIIQASLNKGMS